MTDEMTSTYLAPNSYQSYQSLHQSLSDTSQKLAHNSHFRQELADSPSGLPSLLSLVPRLWSNFQYNDFLKSAEERQSITLSKDIWDARYRDIQLLVLTLRCLRNSMASCSFAQEKVYSQLDSLMPLLVHVTGFAALTDPDTIPLSLMATQMLSNMVTLNPSLQVKFWQYVVLQKKLILRLLASPDTQTQAATQILVINLVKHSYSRSEELCRAPAGIEILEALLGAAESVVLKTQDETEQELEESLGLIYGIFKHLFQSGLASIALAALAPVERIGEAQGQIISNAQLTMLKLLDSWLHFGAKTSVTSSAFGLDGLVSTLIDYSRFTSKAMQQDLATQDKCLIGVHHGLLLLLQCLLSIGLAAKGKSQSSPLLAKMRADQDLIDELVMLLHQTNEFAPPVSPFKSTNAQQVPEGHVLSWTGTETRKDGYGFENLKRDIVRVIGVLVFSEGSNPGQEVRKVQDRVREKGGLYDVLNMTTLDERNPYIQEHAIFTLRYLLAGNLASQDLIRQLQPMAADGAIR